tara:strand:- start:3511 stop:3843 length:333 start_codon:yes stop_codon:yes gene_type:complete
MEGYYGKKEMLNETLQISTRDLPVKKDKNKSWETRDDPPRFYRRIKFKNHERFLNFLISLMQYEDNVKHNAKIIIGYPEVIIQVWTHSLESITDMDREYCEEVDSILNEL